MKGGQPEQRQPVPDPAGLSQEELVSSQEAKCVPWYAGTALIACTWITPVMNQFTKNIGGGKKDK